jgi:uncharacterized membrane protein YphA (DoxX/SURF4 family)
MEVKMKHNDYLPIVVRTVLGAIFLISGTNSFMSFLPEDHYTPEGLAFINSLKESGYLFILIKSMEILGGSMLIFNLFVPAVITLLAPIIVNIFLFELMLSDSYLVIPTILLACEGYLFYEYRHLFKWLFQYQVHTHTNDAHPPELIVLDKLKEENPAEYEHLMHAKGVEKIIMR